MIFSLISLLRLSLAFLPTPPIPILPLSAFLSLSTAIRCRHKQVKEFANQTHSILCATSVLVLMLTPLENRENKGTFVAKFGGFHKIWDTARNKRRARQAEKERLKTGCGGGYFPPLETGGERET